MRNIIFRTGYKLSMMLLLGAATASAQPSVAPVSHIPAAPDESITVTGTSSKAVNDFVRAAATPTHITGKVARWDVPICPSALGMPLDVTGLVVQRVKDVALKVGARVSSNPVCHPNIVIAFSTVPQELLDSIRKDHVEWLGYQSNPEALKRLATVTSPIQAWYSTATVDLNGRRQIDSAHITGLGLKIVAPCSVLAQATPGAPRAGDLCTFLLPNAIKAEVKGTRLSDGLQAAFDHIVIIANPRMVHSTVSTVADYIAVLALAQINSLDTCQSLPSITSLLARGCARAATEITGNDMNYLKAVYAANPDKLAELQKNEIAYRMEQGIEGH